MSLESLRFMMGGAIKVPSVSDSVLVNHSAEVVCKANGVLPVPAGFTSITASAAYPIKLINLTTGARTRLTSGTIDGTKAVTFHNDAMDVDDVITAVGDRVRLFWTEVVTNDAKAVEVTISPSTFPGSYKIVGDTLIRSATTGQDEAFQFVINKAKVQSNVTITLQADGDPSTFSMSLIAERATNEDGELEMMKLIRYADSGASVVSAGDDIGSIGT